MKSKWEPHAAIVGLLILFALLVGIARQTSLTADEPTYIAWGYVLLARGTEAFPLLTQRGYPPLLIGIEAALLYAAEPNIPIEQLAGWPDDYATFLAAFKPYMEPMARTKMAARLPPILLTVLMGAVVYRWAKELWGAHAGLITLGAMSFDPLLLAHGGLAHSDGGVTALGTIALYATWRWTQKPSWGRALTAGLLLGLTMLAKLSGLLWSIAAGMMILATLVPARPARAFFPTCLRQGGLVVGVALTTLWAGYGFETGQLPGFPLPVPVPTHWQNLRFLTGYTDVYFALGKWSTDGWWWYFPLAWAIKNPLPLLIGFVGGLIGLLRQPSSRPALPALALFPLLYAGVAIWQRMNLGYRHFLPVHPFMYLIAGGGMARLAQMRRLLWRWGAALLTAWYVLGTLRVFPYPISFFNELVGGAEGGYRYLSDSNVGWGQTDDLLAAYARAHPQVRIEPPETPFRPSAGRYLVSASYLQGIGLSDHDAYAWFRHWSPQETLAYSLLLYDVPAMELRWFVQCNRPAAPLEKAEIVQGTGQDDLRLVELDCTQTWLYPDEGRSAGIYAFSRPVIGARRWCRLSLLPCPAVPQDPFLARQLAEMRLSFESSTDRLLLYEWTGRPSTSWGSDDKGRDTPVALEGPLAFLGAVAYAAEGLEVETRWLVTDAPIARPFSLMVHRLSPDGQTLDTADGLGISPLALAPGDILVQRHHFNGPVPEGETRLRVGAYWLDSMTRWPVKGEPGTDALLVQLTVKR